MLEIYRHSAKIDDRNNPQNIQERIALQKHCQELLKLGQTAKFPAWVKLLKVMKEVIANPHHDYKNTAGLIINQIQYSAKLVANGNRVNLKISPKIEKLYQAQQAKKEQSNKALKNDNLGSSQEDLNSSKEELSQLFGENLAKSFGFIDNQLQEDPQVNNANSLPENQGKIQSKSNNNKGLNNNDLFDLFGDNFSFDESLDKETIIFPLEDQCITQAATELSELFGEDFSFEEENTIIQTTPFFVQKGSEIKNHKKEKEKEKAQSKPEIPASEKLSFKTEDGEEFSHFLETDFPLKEEEERAKKNGVNSNLPDLDKQNVKEGENKEVNEDELREFFEEDFLAEYQSKDTSVSELGASDIDELSELLETSLSFGMKSINSKKKPEKFEEINDFLEEDFLAEYQSNGEENPSQNSSGMEELSDFLNQSLGANKTGVNQLQKSQNLENIEDFLEDEFLAENQPETDYGDDLGLSEIDELSQLLEDNITDEYSAKVGIKVVENSEDNDDFSNFLEDQFLAQHDLDYGEEVDDELSNIAELSQLLESSLSFGVKKSADQTGEKEDTSQVFNHFLEDEFLQEYEVKNELDNNNDIYSEISNLDNLSQILESNLSLNEKLSSQDSEIDELSLLFKEKNEIQNNFESVNTDELESLLDEKLEPKLEPKLEIYPSKSSYPLVELYEDLSELEWVLEQSPILEPIDLNGEVKHLENLINGVISIPLELYDNLSELETFLNQPAIILIEQNTVNFESLINLINTAPKIEKTIEKIIEKPPQVLTPKPSAKQIPVTAKSPVLPTQKSVAKTSQAKPIAKEEDEFSDLEDLLKKADISIGSNKTSSSTPRQSAQPKKTNVFEQTMKVPIKQLDSLNNLMGELVVNRNSLEQDQERLRQFLDNLLNQVQQLSDAGGRMQDLYERSLLETSLLAARQGVRHGSSSYSFSGGSGNNSGNNSSSDQDYDPLEMDRFTGFHLLSAEMLELIVRVRESASDIQFLVEETDQVARILRQVSTQMSEGLTKTRMLPFSHTAERFSTGLFRIKRKLKKEAKLVIEGRDVLIDKMIQEHLQDPMMHLINNAMTHGIESPEERKALGKEIEGTITVRSFVQGNQTVITVSDDGAGINSAKVKSKAIEKKLITPQEAAKLTKAEVYDFLFDAGFSTTDQVGELAGRGVGLDVVRTSLIDIRGTVTTESKLGQGTTFTIRLPLTLSISKALCCLSDHARIAFPMDGVEDMQDYLPNEIQTNPQGQKFVLWRDTYLPFQSLSEFLTYYRHISRSSVYGKQATETVSIVILRSAGKLLAVQVDQVLGEQEIVIKQIQGPIPKPPGIAGATVLGDGRIMPIADVLELIDISEGNLRKEAGGHFLRSGEITPIEEVKSQPIVLIVDDSITVRELLSISFNKAGYQVEQAKNGLEAWEKLISGLPCDIIFCDVEMPQMDGLELLSNINSDEKLKEIPVAMLTSRGAEKHRKIAAELGASGYFTKPYLEEALLDGAQRMMDGEVLLAHSSRKSKPKAKPKSQVSEGVNNQDVQFPIHYPTILQSSIKEKPKVLIIDDSVTVRELLSMTFKNAGYLVEQAKDGEDAWQKLIDNPDIDLAFCDIEMPRLNGLDFLSRLQKDERLSQLPVAMLTSRGAQKMKNIAAERGARGYFVKPYMEEVLLDAADRLYKGEMLLNLEEEAVEV